jgi:hypothetical protein
VTYRMGPGWCIHGDGNKAKAKGLCQSHIYSQKRVEQGLPGIAPETPAVIRKPKPEPSNSTRVPKHGTNNEYSNYGCRCEPCRAAASEYNRAYKAKKKENNTNA